ncbi:complement receptor type 2-like [Protopterus annectens]|uniref:complement receptor type 2-like n=1 Tax=Protopterus annectens TaxID=7888 RepID=UPI001CFA8238|nr:complement receptor type 2-like [Protopterus annectens]
MTGSPTRVCEVGGWSLQNPTCDAVVCDDPPTIKGGECRSDSVPSLGVVATCRCFNKSEHLIGMHTIHCTALGNWSQPLPYCKEVHCSNPEVENGYKESNFGPSYTYQDSVSFKCKEGFKMYGDSSITCSENNTWVPPPPECKTEVNCLYAYLGANSVADSSFLLGGGCIVTVVIG